MKYFIIGTILLASTGILCKKKEEKTTCPADLQIISVQTPQTAIKGNDIIALIRCSGTDLCYHFTNMEVTESASHVYDIRAKGTYPCGPAVCPQAIYYADGSVIITPSQPGPYVLRYYNGSNLFQSDTIMVQ